MRTDAKAATEIAWEKFLPLLDEILPVRMKKPGPVFTHKAEPEHHRDESSRLDREHGNWSAHKALDTYGATAAERAAAGG